MSRNNLRAFTYLSLLTALLGSHRQAIAQSDGPEYMPSDVMLLLDTSGSMSYTTVRDPSDTSRYGLPVCGTFENPSDQVKPISFAPDASFESGATPADRWAILVNAFAGSIINPGCSSQHRSTPQYNGEFGLSEFPNMADPVYDAEYHLKFNRIVSLTESGRYCTPAPSWDPAFRSTYFSGGAGNPMVWPTNSPIRWRDISLPYDDPYSCDSNEVQLRDGVIDHLGSSVRFGLMTFDPVPHKKDSGIGTGMLGPLSGPDFAGGSEDMWSYFPGWYNYPGGGPPTEGWPNGCGPSSGAPQLFEVGARNPAAPPWEGRLIGFGNPNANLDEIEANNQRVRQAILGMRPFGGTPIAGMLADAVYFMTEDDTQPTNVGGVEFYGGAVDSYVHMKDRTSRGCRKRIAILITDGGPNLDLRPGCEPISGLDAGVEAGKCPYLSPQEYAQMLYDRNIDLFVVGFSVTAPGAGPTVTCEQLMDPGHAEYKSCTSLESCTSACGANKCGHGYCISSPTEELLAICCTLESIANAGSRYEASDTGGVVGSPRHAYWAESGAALVSTLANILRFPSSVLTRSQPVFASGNVVNSNSADVIAGSRFFSSFDPISDDLYAGHLVRERFECRPDPEAPAAGPIAQEVEIDPDRGDFFDRNVNGNAATMANRPLRTIYTVVPSADSSGVIRSEQSVRPILPVASDPDGLGSTGGSTVSGQAETFAGLVNAGALFGSASCSAPDPLCCSASASTPTPTANDCRNRFLRLQLGLNDPTDTTNTYVRTSAFGALINSTPEIIMSPREYLRDDSYTAFQTMFSDRVPVLYAATADGQIHAFAINQLNNSLNELWAFMPPAVLPVIRDQFPSKIGAANKTIISGPLVASEVSGDAIPNPASGRFLTRSKANPEEEDNSKWYSILVGSFGASGGYFAIDVTNPDPKIDKSTLGYGSGPRFLWQLTTDSDGNPLFGSKSTRPAIATLYFRMPGGLSGATPSQHAVAILPGGWGGVRSTTANDPTVIPASSRVIMGVTPRASTALYSPADTGSTRERLTLAGARSISIVRLDTGEVIRTFRRSGSYSPTDPQAPKSLYDANRVTEAPFGAPIVGSVVSYPNTPGSVADRAFVGDAEGRLWRLDLSAHDPSEWSVALFHDAYPASGPGSDTPYPHDQVEPIETPPILSTDPMGRLTIAVSTGEQTVIGESGTHSVWSLSEWRNDGQLISRVNWFLNHAVASAMGAGYESHFEPGTGERVTGPMALFSSVLYFTTYKPSSRNSTTCSPGNSYLWGVHYLQAGKSETAPSDDPADGPLPQFRDPGSGDLERVITIANGIAFGVGVQQKPSCIETTTVDDPLLGLVGHQSVSSVSQGQYQLLVQVGSNQLSAGSWGRVDVFNLAPPTARSQIDSWAAIID